jgi:hypothetical protein
MLFRRTLAATFGGLVVWRRFDRHSLHCIMLVVSEIPVGLQHHRVAADASIEDQFEAAMCRNIRTLFNFEPPATETEIRDASLQFVRKLSGFNAPSKANRAAFERAVDDVAAVATKLIASLVTSAEPRDREIEMERARAKAKARFHTSS